MAALSAQNPRMLGPGARVRTHSKEVSVVHWLQMPGIWGLGTWTRRYGVGCLSGVRSLQMPLPEDSDACGSWIYFGNII